MNENIIYFLYSLIFKFIKWRNDEWFLRIKIPIILLYYCTKVETVPGDIARSASKHRNENFDTRAREEMCVIMVSAGTLCVHSFNGAAFGKIGPYRSETVIKRGRWRGWVNEPMCSDGIIIEHCGREGDAVAKIDCDRSNNDSWKKTWWE